MNAFAFARSFFRRTVAVDTPSQPEPLPQKRKPMTGFYASLTKEQKEKALKYQGPENYGDPAFRLKKKGGDA